MKKILTIIFAITLSTILISCSKSSDNSSKSESTTTTAKSSKLTSNQKDKIKSLCTEYNDAQIEVQKQTKPYYLYFGYAKLNEAMITKINDINTDNKDVKRVVETLDSLKDNFYDAASQFDKDDDGTSDAAKEKFAKINQNMLAELNKLGSVDYGELNDLDCFAVNS